MSSTFRWRSLRWPTVHLAFLLAHQFTNSLFPLSMILYNVTSSIEPGVADEWLEYMRTTHMPEVMETGFFIKSQLCRLLNEEENGITYAAQYYCLNVEQLDEYQRVCAPALRADLEAHFAGKYVSFRTVLEVVE